MTFIRRPFALILEAHLTRQWAFIQVENEGWIWKNFRPQTSIPSHSGGLSSQCLLIHRKEGLNSHSDISLEVFISLSGTPIGAL